MNNKYLDDLNIFELREEAKRLYNLINTPTTDNYFEGVKLEAAHQNERWGVEHDEGKTSLDWFWLIGYLAQKAAFAAIAGDVVKAKHHCISTSAALMNWHRTFDGESNMRPGIEPPKSE